MISTKVDCSNSTLDEDGGFMLNGIDRLDEVKALLGGRKVGLITNPTGVDRELRATADLLRDHVVCFFGPEHGIRGMVQDELHVGHSVDPVTGLPEFSLFGEQLAPDADMLKPLDCLVFDIQDVGVRFYTYSATMVLAMEAAWKHGKSFVVLDRYNPLGRKIQGILPGIHSFLSYHNATTRHGMTVGEIATMAQKQRFPDLDLHVVKIKDWQDKPSPTWIPPSPHMPSRLCAQVYPGTCLIEGTSISEGRGTANPFEIIGAPWLDARKLAAAMNDKALPGVLFRPTYFAPVGFKHDDIPCQGVQAHVTDPFVLNPVRMGVHLVDTLRRQSGEYLTWRFLPEYDNYMIDLLHGDDCLRRGVPIDEIFEQMDKDEAAFAEASREYYLY